MLIDGSPVPILFPRDTDYDLIQVPLVSGCRKTTADFVRKVLAELPCPLSHGLMADLDASGGEHLFDHVQAEWKPEVHLNGIADHFSREAVTGIA